MASPDKKKRLYKLFTKNKNSPKESPEYSEDTVTDTEEFIDTYYHQMRSGKTYKTTMNPKQGKSDPSGMNTCFEQGENQYKLPPPIKIIPTTASIRSFSDTDNNFSARELITLCEDVIKG